MGASSRSNRAQGQSSKEKERGKEEDVNVVDGVEERLFVLEDSDDDDEGNGDRDGEREAREVPKEMDQPPPYSEAPTPTHTSTEPDVIDVLFNTPTFDDVPEQSAPSTAAESSSTSGKVDFHTSKVIHEDVHDLLPNSLCFLEFTLNRQTFKKTISWNSDFARISIICPIPASSLAATPKYADFFQTPISESDTWSSVGNNQPTASSSVSPIERKRDDSLGTTVDGVNEVDELVAGMRKKVGRS